MENIFVATSYQKVLNLLSSHPDKAYFESEISKVSKVSVGATNKALKELTEAGLLNREKKGRMSFYSVDLNNPLIRQFKIIQNIISINELIEKLKKVAQRIVLFGSAAAGTNTEDSDIDLFILANRPQKVTNIVSGSPLAEKIQAVAKKPIDYLTLQKKDPVFYEEVSRGLVVWEKKK